MRIRDLRSEAEFREAERFQHRIWRFPAREIIPLSELIVTQKNGGLAFGAFENGRMESFCFGMPGYKDGKAYHYSRILGVGPGFRDRGLGMTMKLHQRERVLGQGLNLIRWTFDPLQSRNARLNLGKLGVVVHDYLVNLYGDSESRFNRGLETDRFVPAWWVASRHVLKALGGQRDTLSPDKHAPVIDVGFRGRWAVPRRVLRPRGGQVSVEIPSDIDVLKKADLALARRWRAVTRKVFQRLFKKGYVIHDLVSEKVDGRRRSKYLLEKGLRVR